VLLVLLLCCSSAFAHPGGTDSKGGHTNHSTGEYHYHHGYSAHQHKNGKCPYDFDDKTGQSSGSASSGSTSSKPRATKKPKITPAPTKAEPKEPVNIGRIVGIAITVVLVLGFCFMIVFGVVALIRYLWENGTFVLLFLLGGSIFIVVFIIKAVHQYLATH
jgi:hypothetical protein